MFPKGTIYKSGKSQDKGHRLIALSFKKRLLYHLISKSSVVLSTFMILSFLWTFLPALKEEVFYDLGFSKDQSSKTETRINIAEADKTVAVQKEAEDWGVNSYFSIVIPKINATSNVLANIDSSNKSEYTEALKRGVAHSKGTYFPGQGKTIFLFSHSTDSPLNIARYNAVFYLLRKMEVGDKIIIFFADQKYEYRVTEKLFADLEDTSWLTYDASEEKLILMTCDPPGTTWRRLSVVAEPN